MKAAVGTPVGSAVGQRDGRLEDRDRVVRQGADGAAGEARHPLARRDAPARDERAKRLERIRRLEVADREVRRVLAHGDGPVLDPGPAVPDLEEPPRADAEERVAAETLAAFDRLEEIGRRRPVVEAEEGPDRGLEVGRARGAQQHGVGGRRVALRLGQAERVRAAVHRRHRLWLPARARARESRTTFVLPGRKAVPSAVPPSFGDCRTS